MEPGQSLARSTRLTQIQRLLHQNLRGLTSRELAALCGVCARTVQRDILALHDLGIPLAQKGDLYSLMGGYLLPPVSFSLYEAMALFLASRLVSRQTDKNNPHIISALTKISNVLPPDLGQRLKDSIQSISHKRHDEKYMRIFEQVAIAWSARRSMKIQYQSLQSTEAKEWLLHPYFIEMTGVGYSTYVIGHAVREGKEGLITFKLDRISETELLEDSFELPAGLDLDKLLGSAWGIMWGEDTTVRLKFSPQVSRRVKESNWHPSQKIEDLPDGSCILTLTVGSALEMTPWLRGWGADVEVLEPQSLRHEFVHWAKELSRIYK